MLRDSDFEFRGTGYFPAKQDFDEKKMPDTRQLIFICPRFAEGPTVGGAETLLKAMAKHNANAEADPVNLTEREIEVLRLAAKGLSNKEIAKELAVGVRTVHTYLSRVFDKLGVASRTEAVVYAMRHGWIKV